MDKIQSFTVNHLVLEPGLYISRQDGDITTYDLRTKKPNTNDLMDHETMHTCEHMLATYIRNSSLGGDIIYFGPMGCQTGFYLLVRNMDHSENLDLIKETLKKIIDYNGEMPGNSEIECGNYRNLDLNNAKTEAETYLAKIEHITAEDMRYEK